MSEGRPPVGISHLEAGGDIYVALDGAKISIEAGAA